MCTTQEHAAAAKLTPVSYFQAVRLYSALELCIFTTLVVFAVGGFDASVKTALGS